MFTASMTVPTAGMSPSEENNDYNQDECSSIKSEEFLIPLGVKV